MKYNPEMHHRSSIRLKEYDYSSDGVYFVTICTYQRECLFGEIVDGKMLLNEYGKIVAEKWEQSSTIRQEIELDEWIVMPNHFHGIIFITNQPSVGANGCSPSYGDSPPSSCSPIAKKPHQGVAPPMKSRSLSSLIAGFKSATTTHINTIRNAPRTPVWQRNYYEHIIRNEDSLDKIRQYVEKNPTSWELDQIHPLSLSKEKNQKPSIP